MASGVLPAAGARNVLSRAADLIYLIAGGKIVARGTPDELTHDDSPWTRQFFGGDADGPVPFQYPARDYAADLGFPAGTRQTGAA